MTEGAPLQNDANQRTVTRPPRLAVYAGVFDPPTNAHLEIIQSALRVFVAFNPSKSTTLFTPEERVAMMEASLTGDMRSCVKVVAHGGLVAPLAESLGACALVRGMRPYADADAEMALAFMNERLAPNLPTVLFVTGSNHVWLSSTFVRQAATLGRMIVPGAVPPPVEEALRKRFAPDEPIN
jgi:pantetheine-phosphate adenylyltransferase